METPGGRLLFQQRKEKIDWRKLAAVDVDQIARDVDVDAIQDNILSVTYCNIEHELGYHQLDPNFIKLFRLSQLTVEYLLHCQEYLQQCMLEKESKIEYTNQQTVIAVAEQENIKADLTKRNESYKSLKKELQKCRKLVSDYQLMIRAGASGLHKCPCCNKSFVSEYYLRSHVERRHPEEAAKSQPHYPITINHSYHGDTELQNELNDIKSRLKSTEDELKNEREASIKLKTKNTDKKSTLVEELKIEQEEWKNVEQEKMKDEIESYKNMVMTELKESRKENEILNKHLADLQKATGKKKSGLGKLLDENEKDVDNNELLDKLIEMQVQFKEQMENMKEEHRQQIERLIKENKKLLALERRKREDAERQMIENKTYYEAQLKEIKEELMRQREYSIQKEQKERGIDKDEVDAGNKSKLTLQPTTSLPPEPPPRENQVLANSASINVDKDHLLEKDTISLWVSSKTNGHQSYRVFKQPASTQGGWKDLLVFNASAIPIGDYQKPIYVYSCGGSPYWRQYVSSFEHPPHTSYKHDFTFYVSDVKLLGTRKFNVHDGGSGNVIRSLISKEENVPSWKYKGLSFYAMKQTTSRGTVSRSATFNSSFGSTDEDDDDVSLSSFTGTELVLKKDLAEEIKRSRENLVDDIDNDGNGVEVFQEAVDTDDEEVASNDDAHEEDKEEEVEEVNEFLGTGTSTGSLMGSTIPPQGEFYPFPDNQLAKARYDHYIDRVKQERENVLEILQDNLEKHGVDSDETAMSSSIYKSKLNNHDKEKQMIEKKFTGFQRVRDDLQQAIHDATLKKWASKGKKNVSKAFKKAAHAVTACASPKKRSGRPLPVPIITHSMETEIERGKEVVLKQKDFEDDYDDDEEISQEEEDDDYESIDDNKYEGERENNETYEKKLDENKREINDDEDEFDVSESSEWDSGEEEANDDYLPKVTVSQQSPTYEQDEPYNPKMRAPQGEKVRNLAASLEASLSLRDKDKKKIAGAVDLYNLETENEAGGSNDHRTKRSVSFQNVNNDVDNDDDDDESDFSVTSYDASKNTHQPNSRRTYDEDDDDIEAMLASYDVSKNPTTKKPSASSTPYVTKPSANTSHGSSTHTAVTALNLDDFDDDDESY